MVTLFRYATKLKRKDTLTKLHGLLTTGATQYIKNQAKVAIQHFDEPLSIKGRKALELCLRQP